MCGRPPVRGDNGDDDDYNHCWFLVTSLPSNSGLPSVCGPAPQGYGED